MNNNQNQNENSEQNINSDQTQNYFNSLSTQDLFPELSNETLVYMKELNNGCLDCCCSCYFSLNCTKNKYEVYSLTNNKSFICSLNEEEIDFCPCNCRGFKMSINSTSNNRGINLIAEKNCKCGVYYCFGCGKPSVYIKVLGPQNTLFGRIKLNFNCCMTLCCTHRLEIMDASNKILYIIIANNCLCPIGIECHKLGKCCNCRYLIIKGENRNSRPDGQITKIFCESCCCDCLTKSDSYRIQFPSYATPVEKMMIIIAATFVDHNSFFI